MKRHLAISLATWSLWLVPALCVTGVLPHACAAECDRATSGAHCDHDTPSGCGDHDHEDPGCDHESDCSSDPCAGTRVPTSRSQFDLVPWAFQAVCVIEVLDSGATPRSQASSRPLLQHRRALPVHDSDIPLLI